MSSTQQPFGTAAYARGVFLDSLLTGVPQILQAEGASRKALKCCVLLLCGIGFVYQTSQFMRIFWSYPTVLDIDVQYPEVIESPAITFCNLNGIKRTPFCDRFQELCSAPKNEIEFCAALPEVCRKGVQLRFPSEEGLDFENSVSRKDLESMGHSARDVLEFCNRLAPDGAKHEPCNWDSLVGTVMPDGYTGYRNCYTLYSSVNSTKLKQYSLPVPKKKDALFHLVFEMEPDEYFRPDRQVGIIVGIHSPDMVVNPFYDGFVVRPGVIQSVHLKVVEEKLLPYPYETKCYDYAAAWLARGGKGPLSQEACIGECIHNASMKLCGCAIPNVMYYHQDRICSQGEMDNFDFNVSLCYENCQQSCDVTTFEFDSQSRKLENSMARTVEDFYKSDPITRHKAVVLVFLSRPEIVIRSHRPQYEDIEVFSFMGGYVGMWLGVSLIAVFDFAESVFLVFYFWLQRRVKVK